MTIKIKLSILDQSPIYEGEQGEDALARTVVLAQRAEQLGYYRFWVSEHHDGALAGSSPEVLLAYLVAQTKTIRLGSGGVMLQHYSPYKVAENFNILSTLAPGRIDLGVGRAPGGMPRSTQALQRGAASSLSLEQKLEELIHHIRQTLPEDHPLAGIQASPIPKIPPQLYLLGTSEGSAALAADKGLAYVFALFINGDPTAAQAAFQQYRQLYQEKHSAKPHAVLAVNIIVADSDEAAEALITHRKNVNVTLADGRSLNVLTVEQAEMFAKESGQSYTIKERDAFIVSGSKQTVRARLLELAEQYEVDEFIAVTNVADFTARLKSYELLSEVLG